MCAMSAAHGEPPSDSASLRIPSVLVRAFGVRCPIRRTRLAVYDLSGRLVRTLSGHERGTGEWQVVWDGRNDLGYRVPAGVYLIRLEAGQEVHVTRTVLLP